MRLEVMRFNVNGILRIGIMSDEFYLFRYDLDVRCGGYSRNIVANILEVNLEYMRIIRDEVNGVNIG
jgi:hypothetical protein